MNPFKKLLPGASNASDLGQPEGLQSSEQAPQRNVDPALFESNNSDAQNEG